MTSQRVSESSVTSITRPARSCARRVAALDHEPLDDAVKYDPIIEALTGQKHKVVYRFGGLGRKQVKDYGPAAGAHGSGDFLIRIDDH